MYQEAKVLLSMLVRRFQLLLVDKEVFRNMTTIPQVGRLMQSASLRLAGRQAPHLMCMARSIRSTYGLMHVPACCSAKLVYFFLC